MIHRRLLLGALATTPLARPLLAQAPTPVVMCVWGGGGALVWRESFVPDFTAATGIPVRIAEVPNPAGALRSPVANTQYNLALVTYFEAIELSRAADARLGVDASHVVGEGDDRRLIRELPGVGWRLLLLKPDDVPTYVEDGAADLGVVCCHTGTGVSIAANKVPGIRAALCTDAPTARGARRWNDANVLAIGLRLTTGTVACELFDAFVSSAVDPDERATIARVP